MINGFDRRTVIQLAAGAMLGGQFSRADVKAFRLGLMAGVNRDPDSAIARVHELGFPTCFVSTENFEPQFAARVKAALDRYGIEATTVESLGPGKMVWDFLQGPSTIGLVPRQTRRARIDALKRASDFAKMLDVPQLQTHCGFIPENPDDPSYTETVDAIREVASHCKQNGQMFLYETGQETPVTLLRTIIDVGLDNQGVGLDTANLILYGKGNPVDALDVIGKYVRSVHAKDGLFPTEPRKLGAEVPIGHGRVDFPRVIAGLRNLGYHGAITIERETSGPRQIEDIKQSRVFLEGIIRESGSRSR